MFCMRSLCLGVTFSAKAINAPCAFTTNVAPFQRTAAPPLGSVNDNWNGQLNPLAAPLPQPLLCVSELLVAHRTLDCTPYFTLCEGRDRERTMNGEVSCPTNVRARC